LQLCPKLPQLISITETKLNETNISHIDLSNYRFEHEDSNTNAGGVRLFILNELDYTIRQDLHFDICGCENL